MADYETILIPTDGSKAAERGIEHGLGIANDNDADVYFIRVIDESRYGKTPALSNYELALEEAEKEATAELDELVERAEKQRLDAVRAYCRGTPHEEVVDYADEVDADLIVMGKHGRGSSETPYIGSVADRVLRTAHCPVFTV
ncbi:universal stress protein [Natronomonas sp. LN261]|jgi:nucleotide-binding universal stress UspA family protein|uniref:universal stress protein n=1 Tax=Natronomonas sp. LN261 TaxID=2750669 RepID=UPI0015EEAD06|nr:universal stress protein [Natronomonas sp. LN261]